MNHAEIPLAGFARDNWFKQYFFDVGLLATISNIDPAIILKYDYGSYKGYVAQNFVAQELRVQPGFVSCSVGKDALLRYNFCWKLHRALSHGKLNQGG
ncbi:DUF4143 domain-containing protein [bacterium]|nr:DUF4143 domain-containing protein [bacterium]MBU1615931.1 DUF4143 domain-containing protein [bacterium]